MFEDITLLVQSDADVPPDDDWLTGDERVVLETLRFAKRRAEWRLGRWTAKRAVSDFLHVPAACVGVVAAEDGAPQALVDGTAAPVNISLSHRDGFGACAVGPPGWPLGCDLELVEVRSDGFVADYFTEAERQAVAEAPAERRPLLVTLIWSAKESVLKALRTGLRADTREVEVTVHIPLSEESPSQHAVRARVAATNRWFDILWRRERDLVLTLARPAGRQAQD
jgi:4'-phosphopantetheinyl transferase